METITYEELMEVNGGRRTRSSGVRRARRVEFRRRGRRQPPSGPSRWSRHGDTIKSHGRAAARGVRWAVTVIKIISGRR